MAITLFPNAQRITLNEDDKANPHKSAYENYTGIVFDTDNNEFKIVTGKFRDKKDMYDKMTKEDKYLRRAYESKIWDWIQDNAKTAVDGYLMLSTAVSKWINNNVLSKYYKKLLHDLPYINREGRKGDPQTMGKEASFESFENTKEDKMLNEAIMNEAEKDFETDIKNQIKQDINNGLMSKHKIDIYPIYQDNSIDKNPVLTFPNTYLYNDLYDGTWSKSINTGTEKSKKSVIRDSAYRIWNPELFYELYLDKQNYNSGKLNRELHQDQTDDILIIVDDNFSDPIKLNKGLISTTLINFMNNYKADGKTDWMPYKDYRTGHSAKTNVVRGINQGKYDPKMQPRIDAMTAAEAHLKIDDFDNETAEKIKEKIKELEALSDDEISAAEKYKKLFRLESMLKYNTLVKQMDEINKTKGDSIAEKIAKTKPLLAEKNKVLEDYRNSLVQNKNFNRKEKALELGYRLNKAVSYSNPLHNSAAGIEFLNRISDKNIFKKQLVHEYNLAKSQGNMDLANTIKNLYQKEPKQYTKTEQKAAEQLIKKWNAQKEKDSVFTPKERHVDIILNDIITKRDLKEPDINKIKKAAWKVINDKTNELLKANKELNAQYAQPVNAAYDYFEDESHDKEFISALSNEFNKQNEEKPVEEAQVNDGATALMQQTDQMAQNLQQNAMLSEDNTHSELNPELFEDEKLKDDVHEALIKIADAFKEKLKLPQEPVDIYFTGSEANYNYNENSDIDLHLVYDFEQVGMNAELLNKYLQSAKRVFNDEHDITIKNIPVEVGAENIAEPLTTSGVYSLISNNWVIKPQYANVEIEKPEDATLDEIRNIIEDAIMKQDQNEIEGVIKVVWDMRKKGLKEEGEFGPSNTLFKMLRNDGTLARLKDAYYASESRDLSLESIMKEDYFGNHNEIFTVEDDLINKSEEEIYDGLMTHYNGNEKEALAKLEDVLKTCSDGYKDKLHDVIQKIKESTSFENKCNAIVEDTMNKLNNKMTPGSYLDHINDIADVKEMLKLCYNGIHPNIKYKRPPLKYIDKDGKIKKFVLNGVGLDSPNVRCQEISVGETPDGFYKVMYGEKFDMPLDQFIETINLPENEKWINKVVGDDKDLEEVIAKINMKAEQFTKSYENWYNIHKDEYELDRYTKQARRDIYKDIMKKHWRPDYVLNRYKKIDDWRDNLQKTESVFSEAEKMEYVQAGGTRGKWVNDILDLYGIDHKYTQTPFAVEPPKIKMSKLLGDIAPKKKWYIIKGIEEGNDPKMAVIQQVTEEAESIPGERGQWAPFSWIQEQMAISAKGDQDNSPENTLWRAGEQIFNPQGKNRLGRTNLAGEWWTLQPEDIEHVLQIVEEEKAAEIAARKAKYPNIRFTNRFENLLQIYKHEPGDQIIIDALREFDPDNGKCIRKFVGRGNPIYKIWLPGPQGMMYPPEHGQRSPYDDLMKSV